MAITGILWEITYSTVRSHVNYKLPSKQQNASIAVLISLRVKLTKATTLKKTENVHQIQHN